MYALQPKVLIQWIGGLSLVQISYGEKLDQEGVANELEIKVELLMALAQNNLGNPLVSRIAQALSTIVRLALLAYPLCSGVSGGEII
jgi:hypothetical protein